mgnify:CR=1 FL=1
MKMAKIRPPLLCILYNWLCRGWYVRDKAAYEATFRPAFRKVCFFKKVLVLNPYPQTPFPGKGAECGAAALTPLGATPQTPFLKVM